MVSIPACHAGDRGSIPRLGVFLIFKILKDFIKKISWSINKLKAVDSWATQDQEINWHLAICREFVIYHDISEKYFVKFTYYDIPKDPFNSTPDVSHFFFWATRPRYYVQHVFFWGSILTHLRPGHRPKKSFFWIFPCFFLLNSTGVLFKEKREKKLEKN